MGIPLLLLFLPRPPGGAVLLGLRLPEAFAGDTEVALPKAGAIFSFPGGWRTGLRTEPEKDLGLLTPDAAGHRLERG